MKRAIPLLLLTLAGCTQPAAPGGGGIVSTNPCADAMLVALVPPSRIAAISHYSVEAEASSMPLAIARRFATTTGTAEEVIGLRPDLVVTSSFTPPATLAAALGAPAQGEAMVARIEAAAAETTPCLPLPLGEGRSRVAAGG